MKILIAHEKHGIRLFKPDSDDTFNQAYSLLINDRIEEDWYEGKDLIVASEIHTYYKTLDTSNAALELFKRYRNSLDDRSRKFFQKRNGYEYERIEIVETEN